MSFWSDLDPFNPSGALRRGLRLVDPTSSAERDALTQSAANGVLSGGVVGGLTSAMRYASAGQTTAAPAASGTGAPTSSYDVSDAMVQGARRLAASRATQGYGLTSTFLTRRLEPVNPEAALQESMQEAAWEKKVAPTTQEARDAKIETAAAVDAISPAGQARKILPTLTRKEDAPHSATGVNGEPITPTIPPETEPIRPKEGWYDSSGQSIGTKSEPQQQLFTPQALSSSQAASVQAQIASGNVGTFTPADPLVEAAKRAALLEAAKVASSKRRAML